MGPMTMTASKPKSSKAASSPYKDRLTRLRAALQGLNLAHVLITNPLDVAYLTGFLGGESYLVVSPASATVISDFRYIEELEPVKPLASVYSRKGPMPQAVAEVFASTKVDRCG